MFSSIHTTNLGNFWHKQRWFILVFLVLIFSNIPTTKTIIYTSFLIPRVAEANHQDFSVVCHKLDPTTGKPFPQETINACIEATKLHNLQSASGTGTGTGLLDNIGKLFSDSLNKLGELMLFITSWFVVATGSLMDYSIKESIALGSNEGIEKGVEVGWEMFRDVANVFFIFILLYISIATILQLNNFDTKRTLVKLIVVALLINFSLLATRVVIDVSNVLATTFYNQITEKGKISEQFKTQIGTIGVYKPDNELISKAAKGQPSIFQVGLLGSIFFIVLAFTFLAGAIMFIVRTVMLLFLMVFSPLAFLGSILPATAVYTKQWWHALISNAFLAPIYLLLILVTLETIDALRKAGGASDTTTFATWLAKGGEDGISIFFNFALIIGMVIAALIISKMAGGMVAGTSIKFAQKVTRSAGKNVFGTAGSGLVAGANAMRNRAPRTARFVGALGRGLRARTYDPGKIPGASKAGLGEAKDTKSLVQSGKIFLDDRKKRRVDEVDEANNPKAKQLLFDQASSSTKKAIFASLSAEGRADLRIKDDELDKLISALPQAEQKKTRDNHKSKEYANTLKGLTKKDITDAFNKGSGSIVGAIKNISKIKDDHIGTVSPEVLAGSSSANSTGGLKLNPVEEMTAPQMNKFLEKTNATDSQLEAIVKNVNKLPEGHAVRRNIQHGQKPEHNTMRKFMTKPQENGSTNNDTRKPEGNKANTNDEGPRKSKLIIPLDAGGGARPK